MPQKRPLSRPEERVSFDIGSTRARANATEFVLDEQLADQGFAEASIIISNTEQ